MKEYQLLILRGAVLCLAAVLSAAVVQQYRRGETRGATGKGRVRRSQGPVYFHYLAVMRILLVSAMILVFFMSS